MGSISENEPLAFPPAGEPVPADDLMRVQSLLHSAGLEQFADLEVVAFGYRGELQNLLTVCPPEHLEDRQEFKRRTMGMIAIALKG